MASHPLSWIATFLRELKRRKVYQVTAIYLVLAVGGLELLDLLIPATSLPTWASPLILSLAVVGLPTVIVLAWTFDITPTGVVRTEDAETGAAQAVGLGPRGAAASGTAAERDGDEDASTAEGTAQGAPASNADAEPASAPLEGLSRLAVAVLPFENLSRAEEAEPFAMGLHDDLLTELSRASALTVISRTSVRGYLGTDKSTREIARELGVGTVIEGGVQMAGKRVRLNVQLIDARTNAHQWAERYDRELTPERIFDLQTELASSIMTALRTQLTSAEQARFSERPTDDLEAYRLHALGRDAAVDRSADGMRKAAEYFEKALERDPEYAPAWAGLGTTLVMLVDYGHVEDRRLIERGKDACLRAVELDPELPEAHAALGNLYGFLHDAPSARSALDEAVRLGPGLALGYQRRSWVELMAGDPERAAVAASRATELAPLEPEARCDLAIACLAVGDLERCMEEARRTLEAHPDFAPARWVLGLAIVSEGRTREVGAELWTVEETLYRPWAILLDYLTSTSGDGSRRQEAAERLHSMQAPFKSGLLQAAAGETDAAIEAIESARPFFWDEALVLRYWRPRPLDGLWLDPRIQDLIVELDRNWGV